MAFGGYGKEAGYKDTLQERVAAWLATNQEFLAMAEERLAGQNPYGWTRSFGASAIGQRFLEVKESRCNDDLMNRIDEICKKDSFLNAEGFRFNRFASKSVLVSVGRAIETTSWWKNNVKEIRRSAKVLKEIEQVQAS